MQSAVSYYNNQKQVLTTIKHENGILNNVIDKVSDVSSPLKIFVHAKHEINLIFEQIFDFVQDVSHFSSDLSSKFLRSDEIEELQSFRIKISTIREVLKRDSMKVAFFGRTSSGKSTVINAMLASKILPTGIGHTTNCFLQVEGSDSNEGYLVIGNSNVKKNVESVSHLGHALCKEKLSENEKVTIYWPKQKCFLLRNDVVLIDSPGIDVTQNLDDYIDKYCMDADVFVLVANSESTLMVIEKNFFHNVSQKISKPNIFIVHNRWDISETEPEFLNEVHKQHLDRAIDFLTNELEIANSKEEVLDRIFFVSAKEALETRLKQPSQFVDGYETRYLEFENFERKFEECISKSAIKTKFKQHFDCSRQIVKKIIDYLDRVLLLAQNENTIDSANQAVLVQKINEIEIELRDITRDMKDRIHKIAENVEQNVSKALSDEIKYLNNLVTTFNLPFDSDTILLQHYKHELNAYIERGLGLNLKTKLSDSIHNDIMKNQQDIIGRVVSFVPEKYFTINKYNASMKYRSFQIFYRLNCNNLCADFREDLEFKFSWSLTRLFQKNFNRITQILPSSHSKINDLQNDGINLLEASKLKTENALFLVKSILLSFGPESCLIVTGFFMKTIGWRVFVFSSCLYGSLYIYERMNWTLKAKQEIFKKQYVQHATNKLRQAVDLTSADCSQQVQHELSTTFAYLCGLINDATNKMHDEISCIDRNLEELNKIIEQSTNLRSRAIGLLNMLNKFEADFLVHTSVN